MTRRSLLTGRATSSPREGHSEGQDHLVGSHMTSINVCRKAGFPEGRDIAADNAVSALLDGAGSGAGRRELLASQRLGADGQADAGSAAAGA